MTVLYIWHKGAVVNADKVEKQSTTGPSFFLSLSWYQALPKAHTTILVTPGFMLLFTINRETSIYAGMTERERNRGRGTERQREIMDEQRTERDKRIHETERERKKGGKNYNPPPPPFSFPIK